MLNKNEILLKLEIIRLISLCRVAYKEIDVLEDIIIENDLLFKRCDEFKNALKQNNKISYSHEFPDLIEEEKLLFDYLQKFES